MKRFLVFALLYPPLAVAVLILVSLGQIGVVALSVILPTLGWSYVVGFVPAIILAFVDWFLAARLRVFPRIAATALVGYALAILSAFPVWDRSIWVETLIFGLVGAIPAAVCSWLSGRSA